jgi:uncharacterized protein YidB (DUF937 family)
MGLLDSVVGMLAGGSSAQPNGQAALLQAVLAMLGNDGQAGGLSGLVTKFQQGGLGDVVGSWVGTGQNLPISADQLQQVLGPDALSGLAAKFGLSPGDLGGQLSQLLPQAVDRLTPNGQMPDASDGGFGDLGALLGSLTPR